MWLFSKMDFFSEIASLCLNDYTFILKSVSMLQQNWDRAISLKVFQEAVSSSGIEGGSSSVPAHKGGQVCLCIPE